MDNKDLIAQFKLPSYIKGKSFADASKIITKKFEGRNDTHSNNTKKELLTRLSQAQEYLKAQEQPEQLETSPEQFDEGGIMPQSPLDIAGGVAGGLQLATGFFNKPNIDTSGVAPSAEVNTGGAVVGGLASGAAAGAALGPIGAGVGALIGGVGGLISSRKAKKAAFKNTNNYAINQNNAVSDQYAEGGPIDPPGSVYNTKNIVDYQPGVISGKDGSSGFYLYSKSRSDKGFDVNKDREYVKNVHMGDVQRTPQWQSYMKNKIAKDTFTKNPITEYAQGGVIDPKKKQKSLLESKLDSLGKPKRDVSSSNINTPYEYSTMDKIRDISTHPFTAYGYKARNQDIPNNFTQGDINALDNVMSLINPANRVDDGLKTIGSAAKGDMKGAAYHSLGVFKPGISNPVNVGTSRLSRNKALATFAKNFVKQLPNMDAALELVTGSDLGQIYEDGQNDIKRSNKKYAKGGILPKLDPLNLSPIGLQDVKSASIADYNFEGAAVPKPLYERTLKDKIKIGLQDTSEKVLDYAGENYSTALRMAPAVANTLQLKNLKKPDGVRLNRLNNKYKPSYTNLGQQQAIADQELNNVSRAIQQSGASQGAIRNNLLGAQLNKTKALSAAYNNAENYNNQQDSYAQQFNLNIDQANLSQANMEQDINDRNKGAYDTQKSQLISQVGKDIGNIGKEQWFKKYPKMMGLGYNFDGKYFTNKDGDKKTIEEAEALETTQKADGGFLNKDVLNHINTMYTKRNKK